MKQFILKHKTALLGTIAALLIGGITMSFQDTSSEFGSPKFDLQQKFFDTVPERDLSNNSMSMKEFDNAMKSLDQTMSTLGEQLKNIQLPDLDKQITAALKNVNIESSLRAADLALKSVDLEKIMNDVKYSLKDIDMKDVSVDIKQALQEANKELEEAKKEVSKIDKDAIKKEMANAKVEIEKAKLEIKNIDIDKIMKEAKVSIDKAKEEMANVKAMFTEMEKDGLINIKEGFTIEYKNKDLFINNKKQSEQTADKYRKYIKGNNFKLQIDKE